MTETVTSTTYCIQWRILGSCAINSNTLINLCRVLEIDYSDMIEEILCYIKQTMADEQRLPTNTTELGFLLIERFTQLEIPVPDFQETGVFRIHRARCTGKNSFQNAGPRNDWIWIRAGGEDTRGVLRGRFVAQLLALFKIRNIRSEVGSVHRLALVRVLDPMNSGSFQPRSGHVRVYKWPSSRDMQLVDIRTMIGQVHIVPAGERQRIVNHQIDLQMFNKIC